MQPGLLHPVTKILNFQDVFGAGKTPEESAQDVLDYLEEKGLIPSK